MVIGDRQIIFDQVENGLIPTVSDSTQSKRIPLLLTTTQALRSLKRLIEIDLHVLECLPFELFCSTFSGSVLITFRDTD